MSGGDEVLNLCANNYLGLADDPRVVAAAKEALDRWGYGMASVRFICGTQEIHKQLERRLSEFLRTEDSILYSSCFDANGGLFETLLGDDDAVISDELNHASIIDGIRLCAAQRYRYQNRDMAHLEEQLRQASDARRRLIATDGVFSMDGYVAPLSEICELAERYDAMVMVDDSHAVGFIGEHGRGTPELHGVADRVDIVTGTLGKALGGASGGYVERPQGDRRPAAPALAAVPVLELGRTGDRRRLARRPRPAGRERRPAGTAAGEHRMVPGEDDRPRLRRPRRRPPDRPGHARRRRPGRRRMADLLLQRGVYVIGFSYPVVPLGKARIRTQVSAAHTREDLERAATAFDGGAGRARLTARPAAPAGRLLRSACVPPSLASRRVLRRWRPQARVPDRRRARRW